MTNTHAFAALAAISILVSCGGGGGGERQPTGQTPPQSGQVSITDYNAANRKALPGGSSWIGASNEPLNTDPTGMVGFVGGVDVIPLFMQAERDPENLVAHRPNYGNAQTWQYWIRDGVSWERLVRYLQADADDNDGNLVRWERIPTVRVAHGTPEDLEFDTRMAVRLLNSALPPDWQIRFGDAKASHDHRDGEIIVEFSRAATWPAGSRHALGLASTRTVQSGRNTEEILSSLVWVDDRQLPNERDRAHVILHELIHALGRGHVPESQFDDSIMNPYGTDSAYNLILFQLDQDALYAVYEDDDWGDWSDLSNHVFGRIGYIPGEYEAVLFGAAARNGLVRPWAAALYPSEPMTRGSGSASWRGHMLGLTPHEEAVAGDVGIGIRFSDLTGRIDFTNIEKWARFAAPGRVGTGTTWGDGDLRYTIEVVGSGFQETGGDAGKVTGMFYKDNHAQAGGTLRRDDLAAGFGAERQ